MLLADDFFLITHDDRDGRSRLHPRAVELGLAAGLLGELVLEQRITIDGPRLRVLSQDPPIDPLAHTSLATMIAEPQHRDVRTWLAFFGQTSIEAVAQRLIQLGMVQQIRVRRLLRTTTRFIASDVNLPAGRVVRLRRLITGAQPLRVGDSALAGMANATGLTRFLLFDEDSDAIQRLAVLVEALPPPLRDLVTQLEAAVGDAVLAQRT
jgi:hypothetical protein